MKSLSLVLMLLFLAVGCEEEVDSFDTLSEAEKQVLRDRASNQCNAEFLKDFTDYEALSNTTLVDLYRGYSWLLDTTVGATKTTASFYVWNKTATTTYFLHKYGSVTVPKYQFIKMTSTINSQMVQFLKIQRCVTSVPYRTMSGPNSTLSIVYTKVPSYDGVIPYEADSTYTSKNVEPAFFSLLSKKIVTRKYKTDNTLESTTTEDSKFNTIADRATELNASYTNYNPGTTEFCIVNHNVVNPVTFNLPFSLSCKTDPLVNVNTTGDAAYDFMPSTELAI